MTMLNQPWQSYIGCQSNLESYINYVFLCIMFTTNLHHNTCLTLFNQSLQPVAITELVCVPLTLPTMSNVVLGLSLESRGLASRARLPGISSTYNNPPNDLQHCSNTGVFRKNLNTFIFQLASITD